MISVFLAACFLTLSCGALAASAEAPAQAAAIPYRLAGREEGQALMMSNTEYYLHLTQNDLDYRMGAPGSTLEEYLKLAAAQSRDFSEEDKAVLDASIRRIEERLTKLGLSLPLDTEIIFVKTTMKENDGAGAYTHKNEIYIAEVLLEDYGTDPEQYDLFDYFIMHEIFHVLTRSHPEFRAAMYALIGFSIGEEVAFSPEIRAHILSNPDVERQDNYASFTIDGVPVNCIVVPYLEDYREGYGSFFDHYQAVLVPVDRPDRFIPAEEVPDFHDRVGSNTDYVVSAEECMADNFAYAIIYGTKENQDGKPWPNPEILEGVLQILREGQSAPVQ